MLIDAHCHIDLYKNPETILNECERFGVTVIAVTNLPSHFEMGYSHFTHTKRVRISLGLHPLHAEKHKDEFDKFLKNLDKTSYIGEVGLDFSIEGIKTKEIQLNSFEKILQSVSDKEKILSIHSRRAEIEVLGLLMKYEVRNAIFHWYSGPISVLHEILGAGYFFSINPQMINSPKGQGIVRNIPIERILTESDGPFVQFKNRTIHPMDVRAVLEYISKVRNLGISIVEHQIQSNFYELINRLR